MKKLLITVALGLLAASMVDAKMVTVTAKGTYEMQANDSKEDARGYALIYAKMNAVEEAGTVVRSVFEQSTDSTGQKAAKQELKSFSAALLKSEVTDVTYKKGVCTVTIKAKLDTQDVEKYLEVDDGVKEQLAMLMRSQEEIVKELDKLKKERVIASSETVYVIDGKRIKLANEFVLNQSKMLTISNVNVGDLRAVEDSIKARLLIIDKFFEEYYYVLQVKDKKFQGHFEVVNNVLRVGFSDADFDWDAYKKEKERRKTLDKGHVKYLEKEDEKKDLEMRWNIIKSIAPKYAPVVKAENIIFFNNHFYYRLEQDLVDYLEITGRESSGGHFQDTFRNQKFTDEKGRPSIRYPQSRIRIYDDKGKLIGEHVEKHMQNFECIYTESFSQLPDGTYRGCWANDITLRGTEFILPKGIANTAKITADFYIGYPDDGVW